jgi:dienelactone hydrolase
MLQSSTNSLYHFVWRSWWRRAVTVCTAVLASALFALSIVKARADAAYFDGYDAAAPLNAQVWDDSSSFDYRRIAFTFDGLPGQPVPAILGVPKDDEAFPCVIFLHGIGQDKSFHDEIAPIFTEAGFAIATFDQYTRGERKLDDGANLFEEALALRRRAALTVLETRRLVDYLITRNDIDPDRIYLLGASFGAITGSTAAAFEPRIRAAVLTYGGGDFSKLFASREAKAALGPLHGPVAALTGYLMAPADPVQYVADIAPRPVLLQNGEGDGIIPPSAARALQDAAAQPKKVVWYDGDHIGLDEDHVRRVLDDTIEWLRDH